MYNITKRDEKQQPKTTIIMKKIISAALFTCCTLFATGNAAAANAKIDTISYITGLELGQTINKQIIPQMKLDYDVIVSTMDKLFATEKPIKVEGVTISPDNMMELAPKYFNQEMQSRVIAARNDSTGKTEVFADPKEKKIVSTFVGADFAYSMKKAPFTVNKKSFMKGFKDVKDGKEMLTAEQANEFMKNYYTVVIPQKNKLESEKWLKKIAKTKGVKKTDSGLLYRIEVAGDMNIKANKDEDVVKVIYTGRTRDGKVFDSNRWADMTKERQEMTKIYQPQQAGIDNPSEFPLNHVIKGWTEGMKLVGKGGRITLWIPAELAYGERGAGQDIRANEALCFDIELIDVTNK